MPNNLDYYITHIHAQLPADIVGAIGLASADDVGNERFPCTWASLSDEERAQALTLRGIPHNNSPVMEMPATAGVAVAARDLADILYRLDREWNAVLDGIADADQRDAMKRALEQGFPLGKNLPAASSEAAEWATRLYDLAGDLPSVLSLVADELADDVDALVTDAAKNQPGSDPNEVYRNWQNGGLSGVVGRVGGIFTPAVLSALALLIRKIHQDGDGTLRQAADEFGHVYRAARQVSES